MMEISYQMKKLLAILHLGMTIYNLIQITNLPSPNSHSVNWVHHPECYVLARMAKLRPSMPPTNSLMVWLTK